MPPRLPELLEGPGGLLVRLWRPEDAPALQNAVAQSAEHLRPWMEWASQPPMTLAQRRRWIAACRREWERGGDAVYGVFRSGAVAGGAGLHHRLGPGGLEIGYWTRAGLLRRGVAGGAARLLAEAALSLNGIDRVEIHHDRANLASRGVPVKLGFELVGERPDGIEAPGEQGVECVWRLTRERLASLRGR